LLLSGEHGIFLMSLIVQVDLVEYIEHLASEATKLLVIDRGSCTGVVIGPKQGMGCSC
jgi:hypothetical protein